MVSFAIVTGVYPDGISLKFDGEQLQSRKHYKYLKTYQPKIGDRVFFERITSTGQKNVTVLVIGNV